MRRICILLVLWLNSTDLFAQSAIDGLVDIDHSWVQGFYWNLAELPGIGIFADVQEESMFGAVYAYKDNKPSFLVFLGDRTSLDPLVFQGDVFFVVERGQEETVGTFTWTTSYSEAAPAVQLTMQSNIFNVSNQVLYRASYVEVDKIDMLTGGDWNVIRRILGITFGDLYTITDERVVEDGVTFAGVVDQGDTDKIGVAGYFPPGEGNLYGMLVEFDDTTNVFYLFFADNTDMYGRYWLLDEGEDPTGDGNEFRGVVNSLQEEGPTGSSGGTVTKSEQRASNLISSSRMTEMKSDLKRLQLAHYQEAGETLGPMFSESTAKFIHQKLLQQLQVADSRLK